MATNKEYEQWKNDPVAQQEYSKYLLEKELKKDPVPQDFINQFTRNFNEIFKEKT
jgi:hypothetical protein